MFVIFIYELYLLLDLLANVLSYNFIFYFNI